MEPEPGTWPAPFLPSTIDRLMAARNNNTGYLRHWANGETEHFHQKTRKRERNGRLAARERLTGLPVTLVAKGRMGGSHRFPGQQGQLLRLAVAVGFSRGQHFLAAHSACAPSPNAKWRHAASTLFFLWLMRCAQSSQLRSALGLPLLIRLTFFSGSWRCGKY